MYKTADMFGMKQPLDDLDQIVEDVQQVQNQDHQLANFGRFVTKADQHNLEEYHPAVKTDHLGIDKINKENEELAELSSNESRQVFDESDSDDDDDEQ